MRVADIKSRTVKTYTVTIEDGEVRDQPYSRAGKQYRVTSIRVEKVDGNFARPTLAGPVLKKDGSDSANWYSEQLWGDHPAWVTQVIKGLA